MTLGTPDVLQADGESRQRYGASAGNDLLTLLRSQNIRRVLLGGLRTSCVTYTHPVDCKLINHLPSKSFSGVVLVTATHLFDNDFEVAIARNATLETPISSADSARLQTVLLDDLFPKHPFEVVVV